MCMDLCRTRGQAKGTGLKKPGKGAGSPSCGKTSTPKNEKVLHQDMTKTTSNIDDVVEVYFESGCARLRFKDEMTFESLVDEKIENQQTPRAHHPLKFK